MNKSLLIVICDFLLLSLLSIANFDKPDLNKAQKQEANTALKNETFVQTQMLETLKTALDAEQQRHFELSQNVDKLTKTAEANLRQAQTHKKIIRERERQLEQMQSAKVELEQERSKILQKSKELEQKVASADKRNEALQSEIISAANKLEKSTEERIRLEQKLGQMQQHDTTIKNQLQSVQEQLRQNKENLARLQKESNKLKLENKAIEAEKRALSTRLEVAATKTKIYEENLKRAQVLIDIEKAEKQKIITHAQNLSTNISNLATAQKQISKNIDNLRPQTASEIFDKIRSYFVKINFKYSEGGLLGKKNAQRNIETLPISINGRVYLLFDASITPLTFSKDVDAPEKFEISIIANSKIFTPQIISLLQGTQHTLVVELPNDFLPKNEVLNLVNSQNQYKFTDCIVVDPQKKYYGQTPFMANFTRREFAKLDVGLVESIFKTFSPSANDIALTRSGEAIGILTSSTDLFIPRDMKMKKTMPVGNVYSKQSAILFLKKN
ncbi:MAG: hypothetical protein E7035_04350 [Verrucomicrobiaceae bacterium]|nr:hypothetical protein [Verrucomicrobiaceae bacterium]